MGNFTKENLDQPLDENSELNLLPLINLIKRRKNFISLFTIITTILIGAFSFSLTPTYLGNFEIVVDDEEEEYAGGVGDIKRSLLNIPGGDNTQLYILRSQLVLKPVFEKVGNELGKENNTFIAWKDNINVNFKNRSKVLEVSVTGQDKKYILETLREISNQYKTISIAERNTNLRNEIEYLKKQKDLYKKRYEEKSKEFNSFSIENGLGSIDLVISQATYQGEKMNPKDFLPNKEIIDNGSQFIKNRFEAQFSLLEVYETELLDLYTKLKPNSKTLLDLKNKILVIEESLKRPTEIILKYKELYRDTLRNDLLLNKVISKLDNLYQEIAKQQNPWKTITIPEIKEKIWPNKKLMTLSTFIISLITSIVIASFIDKKSGIIYELDELKRSVDLKFLGNLYFNNSVLNSKLIKSILEINNFENAALIELDNSFLKSDTIMVESNYIDGIKKISIYDDKNIERFEKIVICIEKEKLNRNQIKLLNNLILINNDRFLGWFYLAETI